MFRLRRALTEAPQLSHYDVVLMDVRMPAMDGVEATRRLAEMEVATRIIIVTTFDLDEYVFSALQNGASGFLLKDAPADQLVAAVRVVSSGEALLSPSITRRLIERFQGGVSIAPVNPTGPPVPPSGFDDLTERERSRSRISSTRTVGRLRSATRSA